MENKNIATLTAVVILVIAAALVWYLPETTNGLNNNSGGGQSIIGEWTSPWDDVDSETVAASAQEWLDSEIGSDAFPNSTVGEPIPTFNDDKTFFTWIIPIKDSNGLYIGYMQTMTDEFRNPANTRKFTERSYSFIGRETAIDMHTYFILNLGTEFDPYDIMEPFIVRRDNGGYSWLSEINEDGVITGKNYYPIEFL